MTKRFDYLMLSLEVGVARKYRRLTPPERWAAVAGVWCLAAKSPVGGALLIAHGEEVTADDVAEQAGVPVAAARGALAKLKDLHELVRDDGIGAWVLEDWTRHQPVQRTREDLTATRRKALQRDVALRTAIRDRDGDECRYCGGTVVWTDRRGRKGGTYDHVDPALGNSLENLVVACRHCNSAKGQSSLTECARRGLVLQPPPTKSGPSPIKSGIRSGSNEVEVELEVEETPLTPRRGDLLPPLPSRPGGNRERDVEAFEQQIAVYAASRFPELEPTVARGLVTSAIGWVKQPPTEQAVDAWVREHSSPDQREALSDEQRASIAAAGAQAVELNRSAAA